MFKALRLLIVFSLIIPFVVYFIWYKLEYSPYVNELQLISKRGTENIGKLQSNFYRMVIAANSMHKFNKIAIAEEPTDQIRSWAMTQVYWDLILKKNHGKNLSWHLNTFLWFLSSYLNFNEQEIFGIWIECAINPCNSGLQLTAQKYFKNNLNELDNWQLARLVSFVEGPSVYAFGKEKGDKRANEILEQFKTIQNTPF